MKNLSGKDVAAVITSVKSYLGFLALCIFALIAFGYFTEKSSNGAPLYAAMGAVLLFGAIATFIVFARPEAVGIRDQFSDQFASLLGVAVYNGFDPYLRNLQQSEVAEALDNLRAMLIVEKNQSKTAREKEFIEQFSTKILAQARALLQRGAMSR